MDGDAERPDDLLFSRPGDEVARGNSGEVARGNSGQVAPATTERPPAEPVSLDRRDLDALRSHLDVVFDHIVTALAGARSDAVAAADARVADLQERFVKRLDALDAAQAEAARSAAAAARGESQYLNERLDRLAEQASPAGDAGGERLRSLEAQMQQVLGRVDAALESQRRDMAEARSMIGSPEVDDTARLDALEAEMSELGELHAALDAGLGTLRSEIAALRDVTATIAGEQADLFDRVEAGFQAAPADQVPQGRSRKPGRKGEATAQLNDQVAALAASTGRLAGDQRDLQAHVSRLEQELRASALSANRTSELSALGPLRSEVKLLGEQLAEQNEALDTLRKAVERLRRKPPAPAPAPAAKRGASPNGK